MFSGRRAASSGIRSPRIVRAFVIGWRIRHVVLERANGRPVRALALYEAARAARRVSPNTVRNELHAMNHLFEWGDDAGIDVGERLLLGDGLEPVEVRMFAHWLRSPRRVHPISLVRANAILALCQTVCVWFCRTHIQIPGNPVERSIRLNVVVEAQRNAWGRELMKLGGLTVAPDLTDDEIFAVEKFLDPARRVASGTDLRVATRDHLFWKIILEMGLRVGELLALRLDDCPRPGREYLSIVRIDQRGGDELDPRAPYAPRPKTLSRDLGFIQPDTMLPQLISLYASRYRYATAISTTPSSRHFVLDHPFVFVAYPSGRPLSLSAATRIAERIAMGSGVAAFHWHIVRHAFFNRAYAAVAARPDNEALITHLVYYGGWRRRESLEIYVRSAVRQNALRSQRVWQSEVLREQPDV